MHKGLLFNEYFLTEGVTEAPEWGEVTNDDVRAFRAEAAKLLDEFNGNNGLARPKHDERDTVDNFIIPVLEEERLGWERGLRHAEKQTSHGNKPDLLLFTDKEDARTRSPKHAAVIVENKRWNLPLDRRESESAKGATTLQSAPSSQILRYLRDIEEGAEWGVLTNGAQWRLYYRRANSKSEHFLELNLEDIVRKGDEHWLRVFILMFRRESFVRGAQGTFHERAREKSRDWEQRITEGLSTEIFEKVFPRLARALAKGEKNPDEVRLRQIGHDTMILLFRLLFVLYAEDRELLPVTKRRYRRYAFLRLRDDLRDEDTEEYSSVIGQRFTSFRYLCHAINASDKALRLPPYNGGLFDPKRAPLLEEKGIADCEFTFAVKTLSYIEDPEEDKRINYRDLSVQHLGAMYERFLEQELYVSGGGKGQISARLNRYARKSGGSYYTPEELVQLVIDGAVGVLLKEYKGDFNRAVAKKMSAKKLQKLDPATRALKMKVCDPAMGSGHFLVSLVDYLADWALAEIAATENAVPGYRSPLLEEIKTVRRRIEETNKGDWKIDERHLDDRQIIRRIVLKRVVYGADKNLMAVELAKLSLWLHTFTVGAPLTFLDHHLRHGDSLFGEFAVDAVESLKKLGTPLGAKPLLETAQKAAEDMLKIESVTDSSIDEVQSSIAAFSAMRGKSAKFNRTMSLLHCRHWFAAEDGEMRHISALNAVEAVLQDKKLSKGGAEFAARAEALCKRENFIHWETAFPGVWSDWADRKKRKGGFDAVIGNPPWARLRVSETEWFAVRDPSINEVKTQNERTQKIAARRRNGDPLIAEYDDAVSQANMAITVAQECGAYPKISKSNLNLYMLFAERALSLVAPDGIAGLLVPSDIFSGLNAGAFFRGVANGGRLATILDFVNGPHAYFKDVHNSFRFCVFTYGGEARKFKETNCVFAMNERKKTKSNRIFFPPGAFDKINPNTGNAPVCQTQTDADMILDIHSRMPILQKNGEKPLWDVRQLRMLDMAGDSDKFRTAAELRAEGFSHEKPNHYHGKKEVCAPLYVGRMIDHYNHRANSVVYNPDNVHRRFESVPSTDEQLRAPSFCPEPPFWVDDKNIQAREELTWFLGYRDVTAATNRRTVIPALVPRAAFAHTLPLITPLLPPQPKKAGLSEWREKCADIVAQYKKAAPLLAANLSSFALDFVARQKNAGVHNDWYFLLQLPVVPPEAYEQKAGKETMGDFVRERVLRLAYTADDMTPFARDMGCKGKPFQWDENQRAHLCAQLDALYFLLYGISDKDAEYIMDSFSAVRKDDEKQHHGYFTRDLILNYLRAYRNGNWNPNVVPPSYAKPKPAPKPKPKPKPKAAPKPKPKTKPKAKAKAKKKPKKKKG